MKDLLLVDMSNLLHKGFHVHSHREFAGKHTGGLFGFITQLCTLINSADYRDILICLDSGPYSRLKAYPEYKSKRKKDPEVGAKLKESKEYILEFLDIINIQIWEEKGLEADDLIASSCAKYRRKYDRIIIASSDDDLYSLFKWHNVFLKKKDGLYGILDYEKDYSDIPLEDWTLISAMAGTHNDLPGLKGIGRKTAIKKLNGPVDEWEEFYKANKRYIELFHSLIKLPYEKRRAPALEERSRIKERKLMQWLATYGIQYTGAMRDAVETLNEGGS